MQDALDEATDSWGVKVTDTTHRKYSMVDDLQWSRYEHYKSVGLKQTFSSSRYLDAIYYFAVIGSAVVSCSVIGCKYDKPALPAARRPFLMQLHQMAKSIHSAISPLLLNQ